MALINSFEESGNFFFKYRGQIPVILFVLAVPVIALTDFSNIPRNIQQVITWVSIVMSVAGFLIRAWTIGTTPKGTSGRNTSGQVAEALNKDGIYSMVRHPLYLGNWLMWSGIVLFTFNLWFFITVSLAYWLYYERIMFAEERFLERKFGQPYLDWAAGVPAFIPAIGKYRKSDIPFSLISVLRREYSGILATVAGFAFVDYLRAYFISNEILTVRPSLWATGIAALLALILRTIKHNTRLLDEEGRS